MTVTAIECTYDGQTTSTVKTDNGTTVTVSDANVTLSFFKFPLTDLSAGADVTAASLQFNVTTENVEGGEGVKAASYGTAEGDPAVDNASTIWNMALGDTETVIDCSTTGSKSGNLDSTIWARIEAAIDSPDFYAMKLHEELMDAGESIAIEAIENAGTDPATLTVTWTAAATSMGGLGQNSLASGPLTGGRLAY